MVKKVDVTGAAGLSEHGYEEVAVGGMRQLDGTIDGTVEAVARRMLPLAQQTFRLAMQELAV